MSFNFTVIKKNQILAGAVTLMLVTAGYLNYKYDPTRPYDVEVTGIIEENLGDAVLVDAKGNIKDLNSDLIDLKDFEITNDGTTPVFQNNTELIDEKNLNNINSSDENDSNEFKKQNREEYNTENNLLKDGEEKVFKEIEDYFISTRIDRTNNYAEQIESYENILDGSNTSEEQKNKAQEQIIKINQIRNSIMIAENLIKLKGFEDSVILVNENSINVVVAEENLTNVEVAQIQSIIVNEFSVNIADVHIISYE